MEHQVSFLVAKWAKTSRNCFFYNGKTFTTEPILVLLHAVKMSHHVRIHVSMPTLEGHMVRHQRC